MSFVIPASEKCSFCEDLTGERECVFVYRGERAAVEMNLRQYDRGAMLVIPTKHCESILEIAPDDLQAVYLLVQTVARAAAKALGATGVSIFQNNGLSSGQSERHFHVHVVPRYSSSDPSRGFRREDYPVITLAEQEAVAALIRADLSE